MTAALFTLVAPENADAQAAPTITAGPVDNNFPDGMVFHASAEAPESIDDIRLRYEILPDGTSASAKPEFTPGRSADVEVSLDAFLPPGTIINYHWEVKAGGEVAESPEQSFFYDDIRFEWEKLEAGDLSVYYYTGDDEAAQTLHDAGVQTIADAQALLDTEVPFPVNVWIYDSREDMQPALPDRSPTYEAGIITLGVRIASDTVLVLGESSAVDSLRHELAHVVTAVAGDSAFGSLPAWIDEGTAVYFQHDQGGYEDAIEEAIESGDVLSIQEITTPPGVREKVSLFYGQSWSIVSFLIDTYGQEKFAVLFAEVKSGELLDDALKTVYGFDQGGLENAWREANGLPERVTPEPTAQQQTDSPSVKSDNDGGTSRSTLIAIVAGVLVLAAVVGACGIRLARRL